MADKVGLFLSSWQQLGIDDRKKGLSAFIKQPQAQTATLKETKAVTACPSTVYSGVQLSSYYSYFYYYPTMHWSLDRTPDDDTYWVGIFKGDAENTDYEAYQYIKKTAQGSYYVGKLSTTTGVTVASLHLDEFELRIFKGQQRLQAETNKLRGVIDVSPTDPFASNASDLLAELDSKQPDAETLDFIRAIEDSRNGAFDGVPSLIDVHEVWNSFSSHQQQLLFPILEQGSLPDEITKPGPQHLDWPEPKIRFSGLGESFLETADDPNTPDKIVLTISLNYSYTYAYPQVYVKEEIPKPNAWMGMYYTQSNLCFDSNSYIDNDWQWVGTGYEGKTTKLNYIKEYAEGPTNKLYLGIIFDDSTQIGFAAYTIEADISATPAIPPAIFEPDFDKTEALRYAKLSQLAYQPYSEVQRELANYNLTAEMQIYDSTTDTNGFIASDATSVVVAFRGTKSFTNFLTDAKFLRKRIEPDGQSFAHKGFVTAINAVYSSIKDKLQPYIGKKELYITGHSLGGALATLTTYLISCNFSNSQPKQYVYGCPPVGDINLANYFEGMDSNTITIQNDPISSGALISGGAWVGLYKPVIVKFLPKAAGHGIADYIEQLENLQEE